MVHQDRGLLQRNHAHTVLKKGCPLLATGDLACAKQQQKVTKQHKVTTDQAHHSDPIPDSPGLFINFQH